MKLNFDEEQLKSRIWFFKDDNGRMPYLICSEETMNRLDPCCLSIINDNCINGYVFLNGKSIDTTTASDTKIQTYLGCKVFNDNTLPLGEVILA